MELQNSPNKQSRRNWLRDAAIATTGAALMPSLLISCSDHRIPPVVGVGGPEEPTIEVLQAAADNLNNMRMWLGKLHDKQVEYEFDMYVYLKGGKERPSSWTDFITDIVFAIVVGVIGAAAAAAETATAGAASAGIAALFAISGELIKKFTPGDINANTDGVVAEFIDGQRRLYDKLDHTLIILIDPLPDKQGQKTFQNLKDAFKEGAIDINGKKYTLSDLAKADFPTVTGSGTLYLDLQDAAMLQFKKYFWNVMIAKAGNMVKNYIGDRDTGFADTSRNVSPNAIAREIYSTQVDRAASYIRGYYSPPGFFQPTEKFYFGEFIFEFDGRRMSPGLEQELFKDDVRDNIINPAGLFNRDYVYKQFHRERPDFGEYHEIPRETYYSTNFDLAADKYEFTGGDFPQLIKK